MRGTIVFAGSLAQRPGHGGHAWAFLQYILGFRRLGYDVLFLDRLGSEMCVDDSGRQCPLAESHSLRSFLEVMRRFDLMDSFSLDYNRGEQVVGLPRARVIEKIRQSCFIVNVMGYLQDEELLGFAPRRVFLDIDPGFGQMWQALGLCRMFVGHDDYVTVGLNIGRPNCEIPTCDIDWIASPQPVVLDQWPVQADEPPPRLTSVASWRGPYDAIDNAGRRYGLRVHEFRKFIELPHRSDRTFELALDIDPSDSADISRLQQNGWRLADPKKVAADPARYQKYIQESWAEFMVAKGLYVQTNSGWISDRSLCYLASGRPVLAQNTGFAGHCPVGAGLLAFSTMDEAVDGIGELSKNYRHHARAARELACEYFDSDKVLARLLGKLGVN